MRDIKFRVWYEGEMYNYVEHTTFADGSQGVTLLGRLVDTDCIYTSPDTDKKIILMQYTGLKDKNGVEIYEGDVITYDLMEGLDQPAKYRLKRDVQIRTLGAFTEWETNIKVIGNIYQNPDLLK